MATYYQIIDEPDIAFFTIDDALEYDKERNPELHGTKEDSFYRYENAIIEADWDELNNTQQLSLHGQSIFDNDDNEVS